jgi:hypothetical protein
LEIKMREAERMADGTGAAAGVAVCWASDGTVSSMATENSAAPESRDMVLRMAITPFHFDASEAGDERVWR